MSGASGTWTQVLAATSRAYQALVIVPSVAGGFTGGTALTYLLELGVGADGQESAVAFSVGTLNANGVVFPLPVAAGNTIYGANVPAGTRISVRHNAPTNPERLAACVIGVPYA